MRTLILSVCIILFSGSAFAHGGAPFFRFFFNQGNMLIHFYRVGTSALTTNYAGTQVLSASGNSITASFCDLNGNHNPAMQIRSLPIRSQAGVELRNTGGYDQTLIQGYMLLPLHFFGEAVFPVSLTASMKTAGKMIRMILTTGEQVSNPAHQLFPVRNNPLCILVLLYSLSSTCMVSNLRTDRRILPSHWPSAIAQTW